MKISLLLIAILIAATQQASATPIDLLKKSNPNLFTLYQAYAPSHGKLHDYATIQGYRTPAEIIATIVHEIIHIDSLAKQGFYIDGAYYAPHLSPSAWPSLNNGTLTAYLTPNDIIALGPIYQHYMLNTPKNTIANELDEINAYAQTIPFICTNAPQKATQHLRALTGHIVLVDIYLRTLAQSLPDQYRKLARNKASRGALETIIANAYTTLNACYRSGIIDADPRAVPKSYTKAFAATR